MPERRFGSRDFQLYLLSGMVRARQQVEPALRRLDATSEEMEMTHRSVSDGLPVLKRTLGRIREILGEPVADEKRMIDGEPWTVLTYSFSLWEPFRFEVRGNPDGLWIGGGFVRPPTVEVPPLNQPEDLLPWRFVLSDVEAEFGPLDEGDLWSPYEGWLLDHRAADGTVRRYALDFYWRLLQHVDQVSDPNRG